jgi:hypothetical protein
MPLSHHVLVDGYGQLILAHYFLAKTFPEARIAGFKDVIAAGEIDRTFINKYDFILCPTELYDLISPNSIDLITNFISFAEMTKQWFDKYMTSSPFKTAKYLFTVNRYDSFPTYNNNLTILDYSLHSYTKLHMRNCIFFNFNVCPVYLFFYKKKLYSSGTFEYIGHR